LETLEHPVVIDSGGLLETGGAPFRASKSTETLVFEHRPAKENALPKVRVLSTAETLTRDTSSRNPP